MQSFKRNKLSRKTVERSTDATSVTNMKTLQKNVHNINNQQPMLNTPDAFAITNAKVQSNTNIVAMEIND